MRSLWIAVAIGALTLGTATRASAYCLNKVQADTPYVSWTDLPVTYRVSDTLKDTKLLAAIDAAFQAWGSVSCSKLKFTKGPQFKICTTKPCATDTVPFEHQEKYIYVFWYTTAFDKFANPSDPKKPYPAFSHLGQNNIGGIVAGSIALNAKDYTFGDGGAGCSGATLDLQEFMMPMIGTVIGLTYSNVKSSVMSSDPFQYCSTNRRTLTQDDKDGLAYLYYDKSCTKPAAPGADGCSSGTSPTTDGGTKPTTDGGTKPAADGGGTNPTSDGGGSVPRTEAGLPLFDMSGGSAEAGVLPAAGEDSGCCRVSHARGDSGTGVVVLLGLAIALLLIRRGRSRCG